MAEFDKEELTGADKADTWNYQVDPDVKDIFNESLNLNYGTNQLAEELGERNDGSPKLSGGDIDADWARAEDVGEEAVGGSVPTPDQDEVDELGEAVGITYSDTEPLHTADKLAARDRNRMELDPASSEDYEERSKEEGSE